MAAAITSFDGKSESIEDPEIGEIKFYLKQWGVDGAPGINFIPVSTRPC